jgi:hypothetical protein
MMSEAGVFHTGLNYFSTRTANILECIDVSLTSTIAVIFFFIGLQDLGKFKTNKQFYTCFFLADAPVVFGWYYCIFVDPTRLGWAFMVLYVYLIVFCCGCFGVIQLNYIIKGRFDGGIIPLLIGCCAGFVGVKFIFICSWPDVRFSGQVWWFLMSDIAMYFVYRYFCLRHKEIKDLASPEAGL